jgi:protoporphyrinogen oxidase/putative flippase GtrA
MCVMSFAYRQAFPNINPQTFRQWVSNQFGDRLFSIFFKTYTEKVWGMSCDEISADWAAQRIKGLDLWSAIRDGLRRSIGRRRAKQTGGEVIKTLIESFEYPRKGPGMMWEAAAARVQAQDGEILMGHRLSKMSWDAKRELWNIVVQGPEGVRMCTARHVISSAPVRELMTSITPRPASADDAEKLRYRDFITVALVVDKPDLFPDNWIYIHDPSVRVGRVQNFRSWSPEMVPDEKLSCLGLVGLEYFCFQGDGLWTMPDEELIALAKSELAQIGLAREDEVKDGCVVRQKKAYPVYDDEYKAHIEAIRTDIAEHYPTLHLVGRNGMHKYNNQDHAMMTAMLTVRNILAGEQLYDVWDVNEDAEYHEAGHGGTQEALASVRQVPKRVRRMRPASSLSRAWPVFAGPLLRHEMLPQLLRYTLVSGFALALDFTVFLALNGTIGHPTLSGVCGYAAGIGLHYFLSKRFVFDAGNSPKAAHRLFVEFVASGIVGLLATAAVIALATGMFGLAPIAAKLLAAGASFIGVFLIRRTVVFA